MKKALVLISILLITACANKYNHNIGLHHHAMAMKYEKSGDYRKAERMYFEAFMHSRLGHPPPSGYSTAYYNLGRVKGYLCKNSEAEKLLLEAVELEQTANGSESSTITKYFLELARFYFDNGMYESSAPYYSRGISMTRKYGAEEDDPIALAQIMNEYASVLEEIGRSSEAEDIRNEAHNLKIKNPQKKAVNVPARYNRNCMG